jgi:hypothetical protein
MAAYGFSNALVPGRYNIWLPGRAANAYLSFDNAAEAQNDARIHQMGVIVTPQGKIDPSMQTWTGWTAYQNSVPGAQLISLSGAPGTAAPTASPGAAPAIATTPAPPSPLSAPAAGQYNVYVPTQLLAYTGANNASGTFNAGVFYAFGSLADAQTFVQSKGWGVVVDGKGKVDPGQVWAQAASYATAVDTYRIATTPVPGKFSVWFPAAVMQSTGVLNAAPFAGTGGYLSFDSQADAAAFVQKRGFGGVVTPKGQLDGNQPWAQIRQYIAQLPSQMAAIKPDPIAGKYNVWVPQNYLAQIGITTPAAFPRGAFLPFDSQADAQTFARGGNLGVVVTPGGDMDATQVWAYANQFGVQLSNGRLAAAPKAGEFNVWFPLQYVGNLGVPNAATQFPQGAYLSFKTEAEAQAHERARNMGIVLDASGKPAATQTWPYAAQFVAQMENARLSATPKAGDFNVWFPQNYVASLGTANVAPYTNGAYLSFKTEAEAQAHIRARGGWGVVLDTSGNPAATQVWNQATQFVIQLSNSKLQTAPTKNEFNVWFPPANLASLGAVPNVTQFQATGAYLPFKTEAEAQAHVRARGSWGIILDQSGNAAATQLWNQANTIISQRLNPQLKDKPVRGEFNVWFPLQYVNNLGVANAQLQFPSGAYVGFKTEADAQAHIRQRGGWGVLLDDKGKVSATQPWAQAAQFGAQLLNSELTATRKQGKFAVWFPQAYLGNLGTTNTAPFNTGAYLAFDSLADAQAHARARSFGVVLDDKGNFDPAAQTWNQAVQLQPQLLNSTATAKATAGKYNVWFPQNQLATMGFNAANYNGGAFIAFASQADAQAHVRARGNQGVILDANGAYDTTQLWGYAPQFVAQLTNAQLTPSRTAGQYAVWFPQQYLANIGVTTPQNFNGGGFLSFATQAEAQAHVRARGNVGVILDTNGSVDATQLWPSANQFGAQLMNAQLQPKQAPGKFAVWFPQQFLSTIGVTTPQSFPGGAYLTFDSLADATAHAKLRGNVGVLLDPDGSIDAAQIWPQAPQFAAQRLNSQLLPKLAAGKWNVWFPQNVFANIGFSGAAGFTNGAYLSFNSRQEALDHARMRGNLGVIVDDKAQTAAVQLWPNALTAAAANAELKPPPPSGWVSAAAAAIPTEATRLGNPTAGSVAITSVTPTKTGADVVVHVASVRPPDSFHFFVGGQVNGNWMPIFSIPDLVNVTAAGWTQYTLHLDYSAIDAYLKGVNPALGVVTDMQSAIGIKFTSGHDTGIPGWSQNQGTERDAPFKLPAKSP